MEVVTLVSSYSPLKEFGEEIEIMKIFKHFLPQMVKGSIMVFLP